jgi:hypothetical protein
MSMALEMAGFRRLSGDAMPVSSRPAHPGYPAKGVNATAFLWLAKSELNCVNGLAVLSVFSTGAAVNALHLPF